ncbi:hypothetical protein ABT095_04645 [Kitasatospora sp. NPDC002227]|uniref:hypothetical protein n=1 Tax=Kitasatospora sp. NPDC002227 TaxID=3154773 RepID=UPI003330D18B
MTATPRPRSEEAERAELARLLPAAAAPDLSPSRHLLLKEHLMDTVTEQHTPAPARRRRSLALKVALPALVAAGLAAVTLAANSGPGGQPATAGGARPGTISTVAYTLESTADDQVTLTVLEYAKTVDVEQLQRDLDRLGVPSRVYAGDPGCRAPEPNYPDNGGTPLEGAADTPANRVARDGWDMETAHNKTVLTVRPKAIRAGQQLFINFPLARTSPANSFRNLHAGLMTLPAPACMAGEEFVNPLASLYPTPGH